MLYADRFPFRYLVEDYGLKYYAAFIGCSAESEASFETIKFLADKLNLLELPAVLTLEKSNKKIARTVIEASGKKETKILEMDSIQSELDLRERIHESQYAKEMVIPDLMP